MTSFVYGAKPVALVDPSGLPYSGGSLGSGNYGGFGVISTAQPVMLIDPAGNAYKASPWTGVPATSTSTGTVGQLAEDGTYLYVCTATNTWMRTALSTF